MILRLMRYLRGYVRVVCRDGSPGKLLDAAMKAGLTVFSISERRGAVRFCVLASDYRRMPSLARMSGCCVRMSGKRGLRFWWRGLRYKLPLLAGAVVFAAVFVLCGSMTFVVDIRGDSTIPKGTISESLARQGIYPGAWQSGINLKEARQRVLLENDRLSWMAVNLSFGRAVVELKDKADIPSADTGIEASALTARYDAVVTSVDITAGAALVQPGDVVSAGQLLVEPNAIIGDGSWVANVRGRVMGTVEQQVVFSVPKRQYRRIYTGSSVTEWVPALTVNRFPHSVGNDAPYQWFDVQRYRRTLTLFSVPLPVYLASADYREVQQNAYLVGEQGAYRLAVQMSDDYERSQWPDAEVLMREIALHDDGDRYLATVDYLFETDISLAVPALCEPMDEAGNAVP